MLLLNLKPPILCMQCIILPSPGRFLTLSMSWYTMVTALRMPLVSFCLFFSNTLKVSRARIYSGSLWELESA